MAVIASRLGYFFSKRFAFATGQMDPGDFEDLHPLLNAWTDFMNDASFNNPTTALPQQGLGIVGRAFVSDHVYLMAGLNDANGVPTSIDFSSFFGVREHFTWVEVGWAPRVSTHVAGQGVHVTAWHADARTEAGTPETWGVAFSAAQEIGKRWLPFVRAGYSPRVDADVESPVLLSAMVSVGVGIDVRTDDRLGVPGAVLLSDRLATNSVGRLSTASSSRTMFR